MTKRRTAECPTWSPTFTPSPPPSRLAANSAYPPPAKVAPTASVSGGMPSTRLSILQHPRDVGGAGGEQREPAVAGDHGGHAVPRRRRRGRLPVQLRVVVRVDVDEPGASTAPSASISTSPRSSTRPTWVMIPSRTATSAVYGGRPLPSTTVAPRTTRSRSSARCRLARVRRRGLRSRRAAPRSRRTAWPDRPVPCLRCARGARRRRRGTWRRCAGSRTPR